MSHADSIVESLKLKLKVLEESLAHSTKQAEHWAKNVVGLSGAVQISKESLSDALKIIESSELTDNKTTPGE